MNRAKNFIGINRCDRHGTSTRYNGKNIITLEQDKSALDASIMLKEKEISFLVIQKEGNPIGLVTERDIVRKIAAEDKKSSEVLIQDLMSRKFKWVKPDTA